MKCSYACNSTDHLLARRKFLGGIAAGFGAAAFNFGGGLLHAGLPAQLEKQQKRILMIFLMGGVSQFESWDPKPKTETGGPFAAIPTSVPGLHISELLPYTAKQMHRLALVRSINSHEDEHNRAIHLMTTGRPKQPVGDYPHLGSVAARLLAPESCPLPAHIHIPEMRGGGAAFLGPKYEPMAIADGAAPQNMVRPVSLPEPADRQRNELRTHMDKRFALHRRSADTDAFAFSFDQAAQLMERRDVFDISKEPAAIQEQYGTHEFGRHLLLGRRLLEHGVTFVQVKHTNYDTHSENFDFHIEQLGEVDKSFATLIDDLVQRGMWESTLVIVMSEFGRTPKINKLCGRDHFAKAWSIVLGGSGIQPGALIGKTNATGEEVVDREVNEANLFHTYLRAVGLNSSATYNVGGKEMPMADPAVGPIRELLT